MGHLRFDMFGETHNHLKDPGRTPYKTEQETCPEPPAFGGIEQFTRGMVDRRIRATSRRAWDTILVDVANGLKRFDRGISAAHPLKFRINKRRDLAFIVFEAYEVSMVRALCIDRRHAWIEDAKVNLLPLVQVHGLPDALTVILGDEAMDNF